MEMELELEMEGHRCVVSSFMAHDRLIQAKGRRSVQSRS